MAGWLLKNALSCSLAYLIFDHGIHIAAQEFESSAPDTEGEVQQHTLINNFLVSLCTFIMLTYFSLLLHERVSTAELPPKLQKSLVAGSALIPAWAWKDAVSNFVTAATDCRACQSRPMPLFNAGLAVAVAFASATLQVLLERRGSAWGQLAASLALGVGFAVNNVCKSLAGERWSRLDFQLLYVLSASTLVPLAQSRARAGLEKHENMPDILKRTRLFLIKSGDFVVGWAWKGLLDALLPSNNQLLKSVTVTLICALVMGLAWIRESRPSMWGVLSMAAGMNAGWTWMDYAASVFGGATLSFGRLWLYSTLALGVVVYVTFMLELLLHRLEKRWAQQTDVELSCAH